MYVHAHTGLVSILKVRPFSSTRLTIPRFFPARVISHHLTSPCPTLPASSHLSSLHAGTFTLCLPPCILLLKSCSRFSSPAIPSLMLLGFLSPAPLNHFWYFSGHFAFASLVPLALWTVHFFQAGLVWCSPLSS